MKKKILIVDDSPSARQNMINTLQSDYVVVEAAHGREALMKLDLEQDFDLIIMDINMPELNGLEFVKIQSKKENIKNIPTIMCTTETSRGMKEKAKKFDVVKAWVIKPIHKKSFLKAIISVLKK